MNKWAGTTGLVLVKELAACALWLQVGGLLMALYVALLEKNLCRKCNKIHCVEITSEL
jgi:hypothetical protein